MDRTNFNKDVKMQCACSNDTLRPAMSCIYFKDGFAYASDAYILVKNSLQECSTISAAQIELLNDKYLPAKSYANILKYDDIIISEDGIEAIKDGNKVFFYFAKDLKFPDAEKVIQESLNKPKVQSFEVGLNIDMLIKLNKALCGAEKCKLQFTGEGSAVILQSMEQSSVGIIMPIIINND